MAKSVTEWRLGYISDLKGLFNKHGDLYSKNNASAKQQHRCVEDIDSLKALYAKESPITKAWSTETEFNDKVKEAKSFKKVYNKKAMALAKKLLSK